MVPFGRLGLNYSLSCLYLVFLRLVESGELVWCRTTVQEKMDAVQFATMPYELKGGPSELQT